MNIYTEEIDSVLDKIRINSVILSKSHKKRYFELKRILSYFRLPIIIISGINSLMSLGLQPYITQQTISVINAILALTCSIIGSIELYLQINKQMENELLASKSYYLLSVDIYKNLCLSYDRRHPDARAYLDEKYNEYKKLFESSNLLNCRITDSLTVLPNNIPLTTPSHSNSQPSLQHFEVDRVDI
jgi:hypothetical protein